MTDRVVKVSLAAQVNTFISDFQRAQQAVKKTGDAAQETAEKYRQQAEAMRQVGQTVGIGLAAMGAVATAATALAVKAAIDWESAWAGVTKTVDGTPEQMAELEESLRSLATALPATHQEIAAVAEAAGQLGVERENVAAFTKTMIDLSETTNLSADEAATSLAQLMNVMQTAPDDVDNLGAALVALGNDGASTERDIVQMAQRIAGAGRIVGLSEGEVLGFANALASVGIEAEAGGSAISRIMTDIAKSVSTGGEELEKFAAVAGMSSAEFQKAFKKDSADAIATFVEGLGRINAEGGDVFNTLADLGQSDIRVSQALLGMANSGDLLRKSLNLGNTAMKENTALSEEAEKRYETTAAKLQVLSNKANDAAITFGDAFLPAIGAVAEAIGGLLDGFSEVPDVVQGAIAWITAIGGATALMGGAFLLALPKIVEFRTALGVLATSQLPAVASAASSAQVAIGKTVGGLSTAARFLTGPWGLAIAAAAVGIGVLQQAMERLQASTEEMQNTATTAVDAAAIIRKASQGIATGYLWDDGAQSIVKFQERLREAGDVQENWFARFKYGTTGLGGFVQMLDNVDDAIKGLPTEDAARTFQLLAESTDGSKEQLMFLLNEMEGYKAVLTQVATDNGVAATEQELLNLAMAKAEPVAKTAADAYKESADEAKALTDEVMSLIGAINEANGVGQDAVSTNARYQAALSGIATEVQRQKDAYAEANGSLDGFVLSLDEATAAGSANAASLADVAGAAQTAAEAQYELDLQTMSGKDATDKYAATLAAQRQAFIDSAIDAGYNADEVQKLADKVFALPTETELKFLADTSGVMTAVDKLIFDISQKRATITVDANAGGKIIRPGDRYGFAGGGEVRGPGTTTSDSIPAWLSNREFVVNADAYQKNKALVNYINGGGVVRGFASGGEVQPRYASSASSVSLLGGASALDGMAISGTLDMGNGLTGFVNGLISSAGRADRRELRNGRR